MPKHISSVLEKQPQYAVSVKNGPALDPTKPRKPLGEAVVIGEPIKAEVSEAQIYRKFAKKSVAIEPVPLTPQPGVTPQPIKDRNVVSPDPVRAPIRSGDEMLGPPPQAPYSDLEPGVKPSPQASVLDHIKPKTVLVEPEDDPLMPDNSR